MEKEKCHEEDELSDDFTHHCIICHELTGDEELFQCQSCNKYYCENCYEQKCHLLGCIEEEDDFDDVNNRYCETCWEKEPIYCPKKRCSCTNRHPTGKVIEDPREIRRRRREMSEFKFK